MKRNTELVKCLFKFGIDLLRTVLILLRGCIVDDILKVNLRNIQVPRSEVSFSASGGKLPDGNPTSTEAHLS